MKVGGSGEAANKKRSGRQESVQGEDEHAKCGQQCKWHTYESNQQIGNTGWRKGRFPRQKGRGGAGCIQEIEHSGSCAKQDGRYGEQQERTSIQHQHYRRIRNALEQRANTPETKHGTSRASSEENKSSAVAAPAPAELEIRAAAAAAESPRKCQQRLLLLNMLLLMLAHLGVSATTTRPHTAVGLGADALIVAC